MAKKKKRQKEISEIKIDQILLKNRRVFLCDVIDEASENRIIRELLALDGINHKPIILTINSRGGLVTSGLNIINTFKLVQSPIVTLISGHASSMGALVSVCGDQRLMFRNSKWMIHPMSAGVIDYNSIMKDRMKGIKVYQKQIDKILKKNTKLTKQEIEQAKRGEIHLTATQCKRKGVIDKVV